MMVDVLPYKVTIDCSIKSILFCTKTVGISPHSFSTFFFQSLTASKEFLSVVLKVITHACAPL